MPPETSAHHDLAHRLVEREPKQDDTIDAAASIHAACERLYAELGRWVGPTGCHTLFARALRTAQEGHPALAGIQVQRDVSPHLDGIAQVREAAGAEATASALMAVLVALLELLGRIIGGDMVTRLVERSQPVLAQDGVSPRGRRPGDDGG